ncbi:MAG: hypothetical protein OEV30_05065 [Ignavibacteria bacterium]|nr:hypothetical protein [Ignavibacteria bacterium]
MENPEGFVFDDDLAVPALAARGYGVQSIPWTSSSVDWNSFDVVIPRTTWDYHHHLDKFLMVMENIDRSSARLANSLALFRWNAHKSYLFDLERQGVAIVPTVSGTGLTPERLQSIRRTFNGAPIIVKPTVGANADFTWPVRNETPRELIGRICAHYRDREYLAQPFMEGVISEGEFSLFFFNGDLSHTILKTPKREDFRVQEEHGGIITAVTPDPGMVNTGRLVMRTLPAVPLYARVDFVRDRAGAFRLMELELIEPALYFRMDPESPARFARALDEWMKKPG